MLFEDCELHAPTGTRAVMQARVKEGYLGYVFDRCRFTVGEGVTKSTLIYQYAPDNLTFLNCTFADVYGPNFVGENKPLSLPYRRLLPVARCTTVRQNPETISTILFLKL